MDEEKIYLDQKGYEEYLNEINRLKERLSSSGKEKSQAYGNAVGDGWHDNFEFEDAKRSELKIMGELQRRIENLSKIVIVDSLENDNTIDIDDYVTIKFGLSGEELEEMQIKVVGGINPDFMAEIAEVSINSPLGKSVYQHKVGEKTNYTIDGRTFGVEIIGKTKTLNLGNERKK